MHGFYSVTIFTQRLFPNDAGVDVHTSKAFKNPVGSGAGWPADSEGSQV